MALFDRFRNKKKNEVIITLPFGSYNVGLSRLAFGRVVFMNIVELLTDLINDVVLTAEKGRVDVALFAQYKVFVERFGQLALNKTYTDGYCVIGLSPFGFRVMNPDEYTTRTASDGTFVITSNNPADRCFAIYSETFQTIGVSDAQFVAPFTSYLDNVLNGSNTVSERLGSLVVCSPKNGASAPTAAMLTQEQKEKLEKDLQKDYGCLHDQNNILLLPREMNFDIINMAGLDQKTNEKARLAILAICDRVKVPANQVAIIDANSSKSLSNGSELREGDFNKYQSFERLFARTLLRLAHEIPGLESVDYTIYNKPTRQTV